MIKICSIRHCTNYLQGIRELPLTKKNVYTVLRDTWQISDFFWQHTTNRKCTSLSHVLACFTDSRSISPPLSRHFLSLTVISNPQTGQESKLCKTHNFNGKKTKAKLQECHALTPVSN